MRIAIPIEGELVSPHFGRCPSYLIVDIEGGEVKNKEIVPNPTYEEHQAGVVPRFLREKGVQCIITGGMGPRAEEIFRRWGIEVIKGVSGKVDEVIEKFLKGELESTSETSPVCRQREREGLRRRKMAGKGEKICITAEGDNLEAPLDPHFGRCQYFIIYDLESGEFEAIMNPNAGEGSGGGGAGMIAADLVISEGVKAVITGEVGVGPSQRLKEKGIEIIILSSGTVKEAIEEYKKTHP